MDGVRPIAPQGQIASPVDGTIGQIGTIKGEQLIQAKGPHLHHHPASWWR